MRGSSVGATLGVMVVVLFLVLLVLVVAMAVAMRRTAPGTPRHAPGGRTFGRRVRRIGLGVFFAAIAVNAALGIYAVLTPDFGDRQEKLLLTSLCVTGAVLTALCCEPAWERRLLGQVPAAGALLGAAAFAGLIVGLWTETDNETLANLLWSTFAIAIACTAGSLVALPRASTGAPAAHRRALTVTLGLLAVGAVVAIAAVWIRPSDETVGNITSDFFTIGAGCLLASLLTLARLAPAHRWVLTATLALLTLGAIMLAIWPWREVGGFYGRAIGVVLIAFAAFALTVPVLHWIDRRAVAAAASTADVRFCPHCGTPLEGELGAGLECPRCGRGFTVIRDVST